MSKINYKGLNDLDETERDIVKGITEKEFPKIERLSGETSELEIRIRTMKKESRKRFIITLKLAAQNKILLINTKDNAENGSWDLTKSMHQSLESLKYEAEHKFRNGKKWKVGSIKGLFEKFKFS